MAALRHSAAPWGRDRRNDAANRAMPDIGRTVETPRGDSPASPTTPKAHSGSIFPDIYVARCRQNLGSLRSVDALHASPLQRLLLLPVEHPESLTPGSSNFPRTN